MAASHAYAQRVNEMVGRCYGRLTVTAVTDKRRHGNVVVTARCECGVVGEYRAASLRTGETQSCGCLHRERAAKIAEKVGRANKGRRAAIAEIKRLMAKHNIRRKNL